MQGRRLGRCGCSPDVAATVAADSLRKSFGEPVSRRTTHLASPRRPKISHLPISPFPQSPASPPTSDHRRPSSRPAMMRPACSPALLFQPVWFPASRVCPRLQISPSPDFGLRRPCGAGVLRSLLRGRGSQVVRPRSAKPLCAGSIPARASRFLILCFLNVDLAEGRRGPKPAAKRNKVQRRRPKRNVSGTSRCSISVAFSSLS